jgi:hypothetical protein
MKRMGYKGDQPFVAVTYGRAERHSFYLRTQDSCLPSPNSVANFSSPENAMERKLCVASDRILFKAGFPQC